MSAEKRTEDMMGFLTAAYSSQGASYFKLI